MSARRGPERSRASRQPATQVVEIYRDRPRLVVGLLSDTHIPRRMKQLPGAVLDAMAGVDLILHAGDVDDPDALEPLRAIAPVYAVRGNYHFHEFSDGGALLPAVLELDLAGYRVVVTHGHFPGLVGVVLKGLEFALGLLGLSTSVRATRRITRRVARLYPGADVVVFGHTHWAHIEKVRHTLLVNPGSVYPTRKERQTAARMRLGPDEPQVEILKLS